MKIPHPSDRPWNPNKVVPEAQDVTINSPTKWNVPLINDDKILHSLNPRSLAL